MAIEKNINEELVKKEVGAKTLIQLLLEIDQEIDLGNTALYHHFPIYLDNTSDKSIQTDILCVSARFGIFIFKCIENQDRSEDFQPSEIANYLDQIDKLIFAKILKDAPSLSKRRELKIKILPCIYLYNFENKPIYEEWQDFDCILTKNELIELLENNKVEEINTDEYKELKAAIEGSKGIVKPTQRKVPENVENSKGEILNKIENAIYSFDIEQKKAAIFTLDGAQRIRGLAGSGKTVILAMKAAMIHLQNPDAEILYTYYTKALHDLVKRLITRFYRQFAERDPNWDKISIMHAWGGKGLEGVYYNTCLENDLQPINFTEAKRLDAKNPFDYICGELNKQHLDKRYDYSLIDEAQDFPQNFYRVCRKITHNNRIVWAYDDFQNILDVKIQNEKELFGKDEKGNYYIDFSNNINDELQDIVLYKCYRNPRKLLITAFALGLGIYNQDTKTNKVKIAQRLESNEHWYSLGFEIEQGDSSTGSPMIISRPEKNSADLKNIFLNRSDDILKGNTFTSIKEECSAICDYIEEDLAQGLNPEDITVIALNNRNAKHYFTIIEDILEPKKIKTFSMLDAPTENSAYKIPKHITLSTIYKAKGNEAGSVYIVGIDAVFVNKDNITERNKLFTAITRSLAWVTLTGITPFADICFQEIQMLKDNDFKLIFTQPSEEEVVTIRQEISEKQRKLNEIKKQLQDLGMSEEELKAQLF